MGQDASAQDRENLDLMDRQVDTMNRLIAGMLALARVQTPETPMDARDINLGQLITNIKKDAGFEAGKKVEYPRLKSQICQSKFTVIIIEAGYSPYDSSSLPVSG